MPPLNLVPGRAAVRGAVGALPGRDEQRVLGMSGDGDRVCVTHARLCEVIDPRPARAVVGAAVDPGAVHGSHSTRRKVDQPRRLRVEGDVGDPPHALRHGNGLPGGAVVAARIHVAGERKVVTRVVRDQQVARLERVRRHGPEPPGRRGRGGVPPQVGPGAATVGASVDAVVAHRVDTVGIRGVGVHEVHDGPRAGNLYVVPGAGAILAAIDARPEPEGGIDSQWVAAGDVHRAARHAG